MFRTNKTPVLQTKSASGSVATFNTALAMPLSSCNIAVNAWQEGSGDPSPSNVRPIHGFSEVNVTANDVIHTIQLGQEVYGAEVDVVNGVAHVNSELIIIDGSENITVQANYIKSDACDGYVNIKKGEALYLHDINGVMSNKLKLATTGFIWNTVGYPNTWKLYRHSTVTLGLHMNIENSLLGITDYTQETVDSVKTKMKNYLLQNNMQFVVELYNPFDIQLTPTQIETLIGNNTIFADTGDIDLAFKDLDIAKRGNFREVFKLPS